MRHSVRARLLLTLACAGCAPALPTPALAAGGSPLHIDPGSPVAKEYALPLAAARGAPPESGQSGSLFGAGIKHASTTVVRTTPRATTAPAATTQSPPPVTAPSEQSSTVTAAAPTATTTTTTHAQIPQRPARHRPVHVTTITLPKLTTPAATRRINARATPAAYRVLRPGSGSGLLWMVVAAVVVIALGSAGGAALSRRR